MAASNSMNEAEAGTEVVSLLLTHTWDPGGGAGFREPREMTVQMIDPKK